MDTFAGRRSPAVLSAADELSRTASAEAERTPSPAPLPSFPEPRISDCSLALEIRGRRGAFEARAVELSAEETALCMANEFGRGAPDETVYERVLHCFGTGATIGFRDLEFSLRADVVQVSRRVADGRDQLLLTCRFRHPLDDGQRRLLGLRNGDADW